MAHEGARSSKLTFLGTKEKLVSVGFTKQSQRQFKVWDPRNLTKEIKRMDIDQAAGMFGWDVHDIVAYSVMCYMNDSCRCCSDQDIYIYMYI